MPIQNNTCHEKYSKEFEKVRMLQNEKNCTKHPLLEHCRRADILRRVFPGNETDISILFEDMLIRDNNWLAW